MLPDPEFVEGSRQLEAAYLESDDPTLQSGFSGGRERWISERAPLIEAIHRDGDFLDVGCANGLLVEDVVAWSADRGYELTPHGVDIGSRLIDLARQRFPSHRSHFEVADAWIWEPDRTWTFVYSLLDLSPTDLWCEWLHRLSTWVEPGGRLILGSYGSRSRGVEPVDLAAVMGRCGLNVMGANGGGDPVITRFAWSGG